MSGLAAVLAGLSLGTSTLYLSVEPGRDAATAHLSARDTDDVELTLYELPPDPALASARASARVAAEPPKPPKAMGAASTLRQQVLGSAGHLRAGLSSAALALAKRWFGEKRPLADAWPRLPHAEVTAQGQLLRAWRLDTPEAGWNYTDVDLGPLGPGLYALQATGASGVRARTVFGAGHLTALCVRGGPTLTLLALDSEQGTPVASAEVYAVESGRATPLGKTGADGLWSSRSLGTGVPDQLVLRRGKELATIDAPANARVSSGGAAGAVYLERSWAQPGEVVRLWALWRALAGNDERLALPESLRGEIELWDWEGRRLLRQPVTLSGLGIANAEVDLPAGLLAGEYQVSLTVGGERRAAPLTLGEPGPARLSVRCEAADAGVVCAARDANGQLEPGVAFRWSLARPGEGPAEPESTGQGISDRTGAITLPAISGAARLRVGAVDGLGITADTELRLGAKEPAIAFHPERRLLRPGRGTSLSLEATQGDEPLHSWVHVVATSVRSGPTGDAQSSQLFDRWLDTDAHGRVAVPVTATAPGYIEVTATLAGEGPGAAPPPPGTEPLGAPAHATLFVTETGGDIPTTPDRLTLVPEAGERRRGDDVRLLLLTPFEAGTALLAFEPPVLAPQAVSVRGYSGIARVTLPPGPAPLTAVAIALHAGRVSTDRLPLLRPARSRPLAPRLTLERSQRTGRTAAIAELADDSGRSVGGQLAMLFAPADASVASLFDLLEPPSPSVWISTAALARDSLRASAGGEPQALVPYGPAGTARPSEGSAPHGLVAAMLSEGAKAALPLSGAGGTVVLLATAGSDQFGEVQLRVPGGPATPARLSGPPAARPGDEVEVAAELDQDGCALHVSTLPRSLSSTCLATAGQRIVAVDGVGPNGVDASAERDGKALEHFVVRGWPASESGMPREPPARSAAEAIARVLALPPGTGPSADLACAAVRALGAAKAGRALVRGPLARLAQLENLEGGFGNTAGELRRDLAALRGLAALGAVGDPELLARTRARVGRLAEQLPDDDPDRSQALSAVALGGRDWGDRPDSLDASTPERLALWLSKRRPPASVRKEATARIRNLLPRTDVLGLAELAVAASVLGIAPLDVSGAVPVRSEERLVPSRWTEEQLQDEADLPDPVRQPVRGPVHVGDVLEVLVRAPVEGRGTFCVREYPAGGLTLLGPASVAAPSGTLLLCGQPSGGSLRVSYRGLASGGGRYGMPAPALGAASPEGRGAKELLHVLRAMRDEATR